MQNATKFIVSGIIITIAGTAYGLSSKSPEEIIAESIRKSNIEINIRNTATIEKYQEEIRECTTTQTGSSTEILDKLSICLDRPKPKLEEPLSVGDSNSGKILGEISCPELYMLGSEVESPRNGVTFTFTVKEAKELYPKCKILDNAKASTAGVIAEPSGYTAKHSLVLTGSHSYVQYSDRKGASWKNNNSAGLTWGVSPTLKQLWTDAGIRYRKGSLRPANEKGNYIYFETVEEGLRAKIIAIRERWGKATVEHYLSGWGTDYVKLSFDKSKIISELSDAEFTELFVQQMKKESPGYTSQLVADKILIIQ